MPLCCSDRTCTKAVHRWERCSGIGRYRNVPVWNCGNHGLIPPAPGPNPDDRPYWRVEEEDDDNNGAQTLPAPPANTNTPKITCGKCRKTIRRDTVPIPCRDCPAKFHKKCTGASRDIIDAIAEGIQQWRCVKCEEKLKKQNEPVRPDQTPTEVSERPTTQKQSLRIMQWNSNGISRKLGELEERLAQSDIDICLIQESKLRKVDRTPHIKGYSSIREDRVAGTGGGLLTLIRQTIAYEKIPGIQKDGTEVLKVKIKLTRSKWLTLSNVYCPPNNSLGNTVTTLRLDVLSSGPNDIIAGDFNGHSPLWDSIQPSDARGQSVEDFMIEENLSVLNDGCATRINPGTGNGSTPDVTLVGKNWSGKTTWDLDEDLGGSDHLPIIISINAKVSVMPATMRPARWRINGNWDDFANEVEEEMDTVPPENNLKKRVMRFQDILTKAANNHIGKSKRGAKTKIWMTPEIRAARQKRNRLRKGMPQNREEWVEACRETAALESKAREETWKEILSDAIMETDEQNMWMLIRSLNGCPQTNNTNEVLLHNGRTITSNERKANIFLQHYAKVSNISFTKEERGEIRQFKKQRAAPSVDDESTMPFSMNELTKAIKKSKKKGAAGPDDIPPTFLKALKANALTELLDIFNSSFNGADVPQTWRNATIIPLLKAGKPASRLDSFRPVSLTSCVVKVMERMIAERIYHMAESRGWFSKIQAGFRKGRNCVDQILRLVQAIDDGFQAKPMKRSVMALLDLSKAYDRVWREKLLMNMITKGVPLPFIRWIAAFLTNRRARVRYNNSTGRSRELKQGLPQGSVLAPLLFLFYIDTLAERLPDDIISSLFADDITLLGTGRTLQEAQRKCQHAINIVVLWSKEYKMILSDKSECCAFTTNTHEARWKPTLKIGPEPLKFEPKPRLLGVHLDRQLTFTNHTELVSAKVNSKCRMMAALSNTKWGWKKEDLTKVYNAHIKSVMDFGAPAWQPWISDTNMKALETAQNKALRHITGQMRSSPVEALRAEAGICSYKTTSQRLTLSTKERALRCDEDHPCRLAVETTTRHRLARSSFKSTSNELGVKFIPEDANNRLPIDVSTPQPWGNKRHIEVNYTLGKDNLQRTDLPNAELRNVALERISHHDADWVIYTDGSAVESTMDGGSAAVITNSLMGTPLYPHVVETIKRKGRPLTSSYEEEKAATESAMTWIEANINSTNTRVLICTDSQSLCQTLSDPLLCTVVELRDRMERAVPNIVVQWIPAHVGIPGNELADKAAKEATQLSGPPCSVSYNSIKSHIKQNIKDGEVVHERTRKIYKDYKPKSDRKICESRADQTLLARLRSGHHLSLRAYKHRIDNTTDPHCLFCPGEEHNLEHWLTKCARTACARLRIFGTLDPGLRVLTTNPAGALELARDTLLSAPEP